MSITILPYIDDETTQALREATKPVTLEDITEDFKSYLDTATQTEKAMAVDKLVAANADGSVTAETVEKLLGFNPFNTTTSTAETSSDSAETTTETTETASSESATTTKANTTSSNTGDLACSAKLEKYFEAAAKKYNVDVNLLKSIAKVESNFNASATSSAGAMGIMQLMPSTAKSLGISDAYDAKSNIMGGAKVISQYLKKYNGDTSLALAAYNAGGGNVDKYGGIPPFTETKNYVKKVLKYYNAA